MRILESSNYRESNTEQYVLRGLMECVWNAALRQDVMFLKQNFNVAILKWG